MAANTLLSTFWQFARVGVQLLWTIVIARSLGVGEYGRFSGIVGAASLLGTFSGIGMGLLMLQQVSRSPDRFPDYWRKAWSIAIPLGSALAVAFSWWGPKILSQQTAIAPFLLIGATELVFLPLTVISSYAFQAHGRMGVANMLYVFIPAANLLAGLTFMVSGLGLSLENYLWFHGAFSLVAAMVAFAMVIRLLKPASAPLFLRQTELREAAGFSVMRLADTGLSSFDKTLVLRLAGTEIAGAYTAAFRLATALALPVVALSMSALPRLFREGEDSQGGLSRFVLKMLTHATIYGLLAGVVMWLAADALPLLLGASFAQAAQAAKWMSISPLLLGLCGLGSNALLTSERRTQRIFAQCIGLAAMITIASQLMPRYGLGGAVATLLAAQALTATLLWLMVIRKIR